MPRKKEDIDAFIEHKRKELVEAGKNPSDIEDFLSHKRNDLEAGSTPDTAIQADIFKGEKERMLRGFADEPHFKDLIARGYTDPQLNKRGELVVKDSDGNFVKDPNNFFPNKFVMGENPLEAVKQTFATAHPLNWLESSVGGIPETYGMLRGESIGAPGGIAVASAAGGLGAGAGEGTRQKLGEYLGVRNPGLDTSEMGTRAAIAAGTLGVGKLLGGVPLGGGNTVGSLAQAAAHKLIEGGKYGIAGLGHIFGGGQVPIEAYMTAMSRPSETRAGNILLASQQMAEEAAKNRSSVGKGVENAQGALLASQYDRPVNTQIQKNIIGDYRLETIPGMRGIESVPAQQRQEALNLIDVNLNRRAPPVTASGIEYVKDKYYPLEKSIVPQIDPKTGLPKVMTISPGQTYPESSVSNLLKVSQALRENYIPAAAQARREAHTGGVGPTENMFMRIAGENKRLLHNLPQADRVVDASGNVTYKLGSGVQPEAKAYGLADKAASQFYRAQGELGDITREGMEKQVRGIYSKMSEADQKNLLELAPQSFQGAGKEAAAKEAFLGVKNPIFGLSRPVLRGASAAGIGSSVYGASQDPIMAAALGMLPVLNSPRLQYEVLTRGSQLMGPFWQGVENNAVPMFLRQNNPWGLNKEQNNAY